MTSIAALLAIPPLSKVQVISHRTMVEATLNSTGRLDLPFWYFQCVVGNRLELRSPGGYVAHVDPDEVCDVVFAEPLTVQAMPHETHLRRLARPLAERQAPPTPDLYRPAQVMWVAKDKWGRVDSVYVRFHDESLNQGESPRPAPIADGCRTMLNGIARRDRMPVASRQSAANWCALSRMPAERQKGARLVERFMRDALTGTPATPVAV